MSSPDRTNSQIPSPVTATSPIPVESKDDIKPQINGRSSPSKIRSSSPVLLSPPPTKPEPDTEEVVSNEKQVAEAKERHEADLKHHHYEPVQAERVEDDWQAAYVWAFIVKFDQISKIRKLECLADFERCLQEPVANRPDDILEGILIRFLLNLKPAIRKLDCTNIQSHLSNYINDMLLHSNDFTVWDRPWAPNEEARGSCCNTSPRRTELGRLRYAGEPIGERANKNPIRQIEQRGGGLFELDWRERVKLLRQLVDWQLTLSEPIKSIINRQNKVGESRGSKKTNAVDPDEELVAVEPLGQDRNKNRIWAVDHSGRIYKSGNPYKRPCPIYSVTSDRASLDDLRDRYTEHGKVVPGKLVSKTGKPKPSSAEIAAYKKLIKGIEEEKKLAVKLGELIPLIEKEEQRVQRAKRRVAQAAELAQQAEFRSTRTRRQTRNINYADDGGDIDDDDDYDDYQSHKRSRKNNTEYTGFDHRGRVVIPGERRSARMAAKEQDDEEYESAASASGSDSPLSDDDDDNDLDGVSGGQTTNFSRATSSRVNGAVSSSNSFSKSLSPSKADQTQSGLVIKQPKVKGMKGYAWIEEYVPEHELAKSPRKRPAIDSPGLTANGVEAGSKMDGDTSDGDVSGSANPPVEAGSAEVG